MKNKMRARGSRGNARPEARKEASSQIIKPDGLASSARFARRPPVLLHNKRAGGRTPSRIDAHTNEWALAIAKQRG